MGVRRPFYQAAVFILKIFLLLIGAYLVYTGIRYSYYSAKSYDLRIYEVPDSTILHVLAFGIACLASTIFLFLWHRLCNRFDQEKMCGIVLLAFGNRNLLFKEPSILSSGGSVECSCGSCLCTGRGL